MKYVKHLDANETTGAEFTAKGRRMDVWVYNPDTHTVQLQVKTPDGEWSVYDEYVKSNYLNVWSPTGETMRITTDMTDATGPKVWLRMEVAE